MENLSSLHIIPNPVIKNHLLGHLNKKEFFIFCATCTEYNKFVKEKFAEIEQTFENSPTDFKKSVNLFINFDIASYINATSPDDLIKFQEFLEKNPFESTAFENNIANLKVRLVTDNFFKCFCFQDFMKNIFLEKIILLLYNQGSSHLSVFLNSFFTKESFNFSLKEGFDHLLTHEIQQRDLVFALEGICLWICPLANDNTKPEFTKFTKTLSGLIEIFIRDIPETTCSLSTSKQDILNFINMYFSHFLTLGADE